MRPVHRGVCSCLIALTLAGCERGAPKGSRAGPRIVLDSSKLAQARRQRVGLEKELDSIAHDTSSKAKLEIEFVSVMRQARLVETQETLARLGYGTRITGVLDAGTRDAIRDFEQYHGIPDTGAFDAPELTLALESVDRITNNQFGLKDLSVWTSPWSTSVHAEGTWQGADPPRQTSDIWCYRQLRTCHEVMAYLVQGQLYVGSTDYQVELWNDDELQARGDAVCVSEVLSINRASEAVILVRSSRNQQLKSCTEVRQPFDDVAMRLVAGRIVTDSLSRQAIPYMRYGKAATALLSRMDSLAKRAK